MVRRVFASGIVIAALILSCQAAPLPNEVIVVNAATQPVPVVGTITGAVTAAIAPSREPFQKDVSVMVDAGVLSNTSTFLVPGDKRLVLEYASGSTRVDDKELVRVNIATTAGGVSVTHTLAPDMVRRDLDVPTQDDFIVTYGQTVRIYADPGTQVTITATRSEIAEITPTFFQLAVSGYLVNCGAAPGCPIPW
ncbi:MAG TPA: hypothetical protein VIH35_07930 [Kiritimatiellia bacterium]